MKFVNTLFLTQNTETEIEAAYEKRGRQLFFEIGNKRLGRKLAKERKGGDEQKLNAERFKKPLFFIGGRDHALLFVGEGENGRGKRRALCPFDQGLVPEMHAVKIAK